MRSILNKNKLNILCGGRHGEYYKQIDKLFQRLSQIAKLVFFADGSVVDDKLDTWLKRQDTQYEQQIQIFDMVYKKIPIETIAKTAKAIPTMSHLEIIVNRAEGL